MDMKPREITLGPVTYELQRAYRNESTLAELLAHQITQHVLENPSFDEARKNAV